MANVVLGRSGSHVVVASEICVKSGIRTTERVIIRGSTIPGWVNVLLFFTVIGWLIASRMTSRRYRIDLPFTHAIHGRWRRIRRIAWLLGLVGVGGTIWAAQADVEHAGMLLGLSIGGLTLGLRNAWGPQRRHPSGSRREATARAGAPRRRRRHCPFFAGGCGLKLTGSSTSDPHLTCRSRGHPTARSRR
jgi:hypothetical protein